MRDDLGFSRESVYYDYDNSFLLVAYSIGTDAKPETVVEVEHFTDQLIVADRKEERREAQIRWVRQRRETMMNRLKEAKENK